MTNILEKLIELYEISHEGYDSLTTRGLIHEIIIDIVSKDTITMEQANLIFDRLAKIRRQSIKKLKAQL